MKEYEEPCHTTKASPSVKFKYLAYYILHLGVLDETKRATKLRVVFDASAKTTPGKSLNDILGGEHTIRDTILSILIKYREN